MKAISLQCCKDTLENNEPEEVFKDLIEAKKVSAKKLNQILYSNKKYKSTNHM